MTGQEIDAFEQEQYELLKQPGGDSKARHNMIRALIVAVTGALDTGQETTLFVRIGCKFLRIIKLLDDDDQ